METVMSSLSLALYSSTFESSGKSKRPVNLCNYYYCKRSGLYVMSISNIITQYCHINLPVQEAAIRTSFIHIVRNEIRYKCLASPRWSLKAKNQRFFGHIVRVVSLQHACQFVDDDVLTKEFLAKVVVEVDVNKTSRVILGLTLDLLEDLFEKQIALSRCKLQESYKVFTCKVAWDEVVYTALAIYTF